MRMHSQLLAALRPIFNLCSDLMSTLTKDGCHKYTIQQLEQTAAANGSAVGRALAGRGGRLGAVGFLSPISEPDARQYWTEVYSEVSQQMPHLLTAVHG